MFKLHLEVPRSTADRRLRHWSRAWRSVASCRQTSRYRSAGRDSGQRRERRAV